jgi:hypothetical protein
MNKARRTELMKLHYKRRLKNLRLKDGVGHLFAYRSHGSPCSCIFCSPYKYDRAKEKISFMKIIKDTEVG